ncbi:DUF4440 domain-containing protein [Halobacillus litoralis]|uniref:DUF4440 domain-containing protein n=1 Tax=Halobacillus litoralis TaxID=45668 RepID=A0A410MI70_9BACI|nr:DUF4440 domain-containing protein [Halobacillus litoralis]QAS54424.1 DUF4440 domain-containing protein [Halobacillus litoralis]
MTRSLKEQLHELEERHINPEVRSSVEKLGEILADDFWEIGSSGRSYNKKECLELGVVLSEMTIHNYEIDSLAPDIVLASYFIEDKTRKRNTLRSSIWKRIDGRWQLYFHQGTITDLHREDSWKK